MSSRVLEETAERCIRLAYQCRNKDVERFFRLLAVDLMLAAQQPAAAKPMAITTFADELAELGRLSRRAANDTGFRPGSASTA